MAGGTLGRSGRRRGGIINSINITPMVDVMLVLLVILMVSSTYIVSQTLKVELPRARSSDGAAQSPTILTLLRDGGVRFNSEPIGEEEVLPRLKLALAETPDLSLVLSADREVPHGRVVHFIDLAKLQGIRKFAINVEQRD
jgi:biopolymer transport protein ExbD